LRWQKRARLAIAIFAVAFTVVVVLAFRHRPAASPAVSPGAADPSAVVVSTGGDVARYTGTHKDVTIEYDRELTYADGTTKLVGVRVVTTDHGARARSFRVEAKEGHVGANQSTLTMAGDVRLTASDGLTARAEHATYTDRDETVHAPGPVSFSRGRLSGSGVGMTYDRRTDAMTIESQSTVHLAPGADGAAASEIRSGSATIVRRDHRLRFDGGVHIEREGQTIDTGQAIVHLTPDDHIRLVELHEGAQITGTSGGAGALRALGGQDMNLEYAADGQTLQHALVTGAAVIQLAGSGAANREIDARTVDITFAPDGQTPIGLKGRDDVTLTFPAEAGAAERVVRATTLDASGPPRRGLTRAEFGGDVRYRERGEASRAVNARMLTVALSPGLGTLEAATFSHDVHFAQDKMEARAAVGKYQPAAGTLGLSGSEPGTPTPHVVTDQISVDANTIDVTLAGPRVKATGSVKSVLRPGSSTAGHRMPAILQRDQPVNVTAAALDYDGADSTATYTGTAQLWQGDTSVRADTVVIESGTGNLTATGSAATSIALEETDPKTKAKQRTRSIATAKSFAYEDDIRRATYADDAHVNGLQGDITASKIELYLKPSGDELERAEAYTKVTVHESGRTVTGDRLTYFGADERYVVTGAPVRIVDECERETTGRTLTFYRATDTILVDGNQQIRTQTRGGGKCSGGA
jgi:LPS export ABC transporter protein LptC/lipopolysaccharide transport protein LptA